MGGYGLQANVVGKNTDLPILEGLLNTKDPKVVRSVCRDMYYHDPVCGSTADLMSMLPFGDFSLTGLPENEVMDTFMRSIESTRIKTLLPYIGLDYLVNGAHLSVLNYSKQKRYFDSVMPQNLDFAEIKPVPIFGHSPIIDLNFPREFAKLLTDNKDPRLKDMKDFLSEDMVKGIKAGKIPLQPENTLYIPRQTFSYEGVGVSYFERCLPIYIMDKALMRGTIDLAHRRQRAILHIAAGDPENWIPTSEELASLSGAFMQADMDPIGAMVATRHDVQVNEVQMGGEFWKAADTSEYSTQQKLRALGISEAFLAGDANFNCQVGSTLIPTEKGLIRIDEIAGQKDVSSLKKGYREDIDLKIGSIEKPQRAARWYYTGKAPTLKIKTELGNSIQGTPNHPNLVLENGELVWKTSKTCQVGDLLCINPQQITRKSELHFDLSGPVIATHGGQPKGVTKPSKMTPDLAFFMGSIIAEGTLGSKNNSYQVTFYNSDIAYIKRMKVLFLTLFGLDLEPWVVMEEGTKVVINGVNTQATSNCYAIGTRSILLARWMEELGILYQEGRRKGKTASHYKEIPWSILQADEESQFAFLAAYLEGDGHIRNDQGKIIWSSASKKLINQLQILLNSHGYAPRISYGPVWHLTLDNVESAHIWSKISKYMITKKLLHYQNNGKCRNSVGIPTDYWVNLLSSRQVKFNRHGTTFINDYGKEITIRGWKNIARNQKKFLYDQADNGYLDTFLDHLKQISKCGYKQLTKLLSLRYRFTAITEIKKGSRKHVYDISMGEGKQPAFIANGLVVHNTVDATLSVFIQNIRAYRDMITRKVFYERMFPYISITNDFKKDSRYTVTSAKEEAVLAARKELLASLPLEMRQLIEQQSDKPRYITLSNDHMLNMNDFVIPTVNWHNHLQPQADQEMLGLLNTLNQMGVPTPIRMLASAGGVNLQNILHGIDEDILIRKQVAEYREKIAEISGDEGLGVDEMATASAQNIWKIAAALGGHSGVSPVPLKDRQFNPDVHGPFNYSKSGKVRPSSKAERIAKGEKLNKQIVEASRKRREEAAYRAKMGIPDTTPLSGSPQAKSDIYGVI